MAFLIVKGPSEKDLNPAVQIANEQDPSAIAFLKQFARNHEKAERFFELLVREGVEAIIIARGVSEREIEQAAKLAREKGFEALAFLAEYERRDRQFDDIIEYFERYGFKAVIVATGLDEKELKQAAQKIEEKGFKALAFSGRIDQENHNINDIFELLQRQGLRAIIAATGLSERELSWAQRAAQQYGLDIIFANGQFDEQDNRFKHFLEPIRRQGAA
uniref:Octarellin V.1 n=1 Tax=synthetic construct TaxID=32630 RepID=UPI0007D70FB5|nr:Chain B, Octarellin V.1 [synthetic construct]5BOP_B Chain B, Octarellin V.1 [synthetic construct]5BOP_D Chain D, Octarellin V.1 [synthetic construct]6BZX_B Chain B, Octarellin V.1 [synthetic construct]